MCNQVDRPFEPASHHLLVSGGERRYLQKIGILDITGIAKALSIGLLPACYETFVCDEIASMHEGVIPYNRDEEQSRFTAYMLRFPGIACRMLDGEFRLLDGRKRVRQAFREGASDVRVAVFALEDARQLGLIDESQATWKVIEATQDHPLEATDRVNLRDALVAAEAYPSEGGRPPLTPLQSRLQSFMTYYLNALIDCEDFVRRTHPQSALIPSAGGTRTNKKVWARNFFGLFMQENGLPFSLSYDVITNNAASAIREVTKLTTRSEFKQRAKVDWTRMPPNEIVTERDAMVTQCLLTMKASFRLDLEMMTARHLFHREHEEPSIDFVEVHDVYYHRSLQGNRILYSREFIASRLSLEEQILATMLTGISMTRVYHTYAYLDPLFEAHLVRFNLLHFGHAEVRAGVIETASYRRDMVMLDIEDQFSAYWEELFELWRECGINDQILVEFLKLKEIEESFGQPQCILNPNFI